jgi:cytochrome c biogenesis factor
MASLEDRFALWRRDLAEALGGSAETLEELEGHLRDDVHRRIATGEPADAAFTAAAAQLGSASLLAAEIARSEPAVPWLPVRLAVIVLIAGAGWLGGMLLPRHEQLLAAHVLAITLGYSITFLIGAVAACYVVSRPFGAPGARQMQSLIRATGHLTLTALVVTAVGIVLGGFWAQEHLGRFWGWDPKECAGLIVLVWDAAMFGIIRKRLIGDHAIVLLGFAGNAVVALAWFGPALLGLGLHSYGMPSLGVLVVVFIVAQAGLACLGLIPAGALRRRVHQG